MKRFVEMKLFLLMQDTSQVGTDTQSLAKSYDDFASFLFTETTTTGDKAAFCQTLCYTRVELSDLYSLQASVLKKKCTNNMVFRESHSPC